MCRIRLGMLATPKPCLLRIAHRGVIPQRLKTALTWLCTWGPGGPARGRRDRQADWHVSGSANSGRVLRPRHASGPDFVPCHGQRAPEQKRCTQSCVPPAIRNIDFNALLRQRYSRLFTLGYTVSRGCVSGMVASSDAMMHFGVYLWVIVLLPSAQCATCLYRCASGMVA